MSEIDLTCCGNLMSELRNFPFGAPLSITVNGRPVTAAKFEKNDACAALIIEIAEEPAITAQDIPAASNGELE